MFLAFLAHVTNLAKFGLSILDCGKGTVCAPIAG